MLTSPPVRAAAHVMISVPPKPNAVRPFTSSIIRCTLARQCGSCSSISVEITVSKCRPG
jgi:hypothetical protein